MGHVSKQKARCCVVPTISYLGDQVAGLQTGLVRVVDAVGAALEGPAHRRDQLQLRRVRGLQPPLLLQHRPQRVEVVEQRPGAGRHDPHELHFSRRLLAERVVAAEEVAAELRPSHSVGVQTSGGSDPLGRRPQFCAGGGHHDLRAAAEEVDELCLELFAESRGAADHGPRQNASCHEAVVVSPHQLARHTHGPRALCLAPVLSGRCIYARECRRPRNGNEIRVVLGATRQTVYIRIVPVGRGTRGRVALRAQHAPFCSGHCNK